MQTDMHYYGTYCLARAAGVDKSFAQAIATASEYVDDSDDFTKVLSDKSMIVAVATAHHPINKANLNEVNQREVWVPFHFIPGNEGVTYEEKLICRKNSNIAQEMVKHNLEQSLENESLGPALIGITAHVYADTFAHYGFSGIYSNENLVISKSIKTKIHDNDLLQVVRAKYEDFIIKQVQNPLSKNINLGHAGVGIYPDLPYLEWSFEYESSGKSSGKRNNQETFLEACEMLYGLFEDYATISGHQDPKATKPFEEIREKVKSILSFEGEMKARAAKWKNAAKDGEIFNIAEEIPEYNPSGFEAELQKLEEFTSETIKNTNIFGFLNAARIHRNYVLDELLPKYDLSVISRM